MKVIAVIRHLRGSRPVVHTVVNVPDDIDDVANFADHVMNEAAKQHCEKFVEYENAAWYADIVNVTT